MKPSGAHTHPELRGSGGNGWLVILGAVVLAAIADPAAHAISDLIEVLAIAMAAALAVACLAAALIHQVRRRSTRALTQQAWRPLQTPKPRTLGAQEIHLHFHALSAEEVAAIIARPDKVCGPPGSIHEVLGEAGE